MDHSEDPAVAPAGTPTDRAFTSIVRALAVDDPRFVRRVTTPPPGGLGTGELMIIVALLATVLLGILPLALGLQTGATVLLVLGAIGTAVLPVAAPLLVRVLVRRARPMMG